MITRLLVPALLTATLYVSGCVGQSQDSGSADILQVLPDCAATCLVGAYSQGICAPTDPSCSCVNPDFQRAVTLCVSGNCTVPEALFTKNVTSTACNAPVRDRAQKHTTIVSALVGLSTAAVGIRFGYRLFVAKATPGIDDWFILATFLCVIASHIVTEAGTVPNGLGKDLYTLSPQQITNFLYYFWFMAWIYFLMIVMTKLAIQFFFLRIFPSQLAQRMLWTTIGFTVLWGVAFVAGCLGQCTPVSFNWTKWDGLHQGRCIDITAFTWTHAVLSIMIDCWMLALPLWQIKGLQMSLKKKVGVALMFFVGTFVTVISIIRLHSLVIFSSSDNVTYDYFDVSIWSSIEVTVGVICSCMPTIRMALAKLFPSIMRGSSAHTRRKTTNPTDAMSAAGRGTRRSRLSQSNAGTRGGSDPQHGYRLEGPNAGSTHVVVQGGHVTLSNVEKGQGRAGTPNKGYGDVSHIMVLQERSVRSMSEVELDSADGDGTSRGSDRGDEVTLVELKDLEPRSPR